MNPTQPSLAQSPPVSYGQLLIQRGSDYLYFRDPIRVISTADPAAVKSALEEIDNAVNTSGHYAAGFLTYEASAAFDLKTHPTPAGDLPLLWFGIYAPPQTTILPGKTGSSYQIGPWRVPIDKTTYCAQIAQIKEQIASGNTYQVNYTMPLKAPFSGDPWALFTDLAQAQEGANMAYLNLGSHVVCSASPELFFYQDGDILTTRPMKGTGKRGRTLAEDRQNINSLHASTKDRAENVMIVDMIRNDLGRVAQIGTVAVPQLFTVERYPTLLQMTSTVTARSEEAFPQIMEAMFPCASITGAPKIRTMEIIHALEPEARGIYTGSIGYLGPQREANFNVAIRTVVIDLANEEATYGVGSGIVWDSDALAEYEECKLKSQVLVRRQPPFELLESLLWQPGAGYYLLDHHLQRLAGSAEYFNFPFDEAAVRQALSSLVENMDTAQKVRLLLARDGCISSQVIPLASGSMIEPVRVGLAENPVSSGNFWLYHKTTQRDVYETAQNSRPDLDQVILWNERGEITEAFTNNIVVKLDGKLLTPPVSSGLLAGIFRQHLLQEGVIAERVITIEDLSRCEEIYLINSVRQWQKAIFVE